MIAVLLADDHPVFASGLRAVFAAEADISICAVATTGRDAIAAAIEHRPDVAVLDLNMPDGDGLWVSAQLAAAGLPTRVLILTMYDDEENVLAALRAGAFGYTLKGAGTRRVGRRRTFGRPRRSLVRRRDRCSHAAAVRAYGQQLTLSAAHRAGN